MLRTAEICSELIIMLYKGAVYMVENEVIHSSLVNSSDLHLYFIFTRTFRYFHSLLMSAFLPIIYV